MYEFDNTFRRNYELHVQPNLDGQEGVRFYFPGALTVGGRDGVTIKVVPQEGPAWIGTFAFGGLRRNEAKALFTTPEVGKLLVVSRGAGYFVSASDPREWKPALTVPTTDVRSIHDRGLIVLASFTDLLAYNEKGLAWRTKRISWDDLKLLSTSANEIKGEFWDLQTEATQQFAVDLATGSVEGGAQFPKMKLTPDE
jgi:hypothetical protein